MSPLRKAAKGLHKATRACHAGGMIQINMRVLTHSWHGLRLYRCLDHDMAMPSSGSPSVPLAESMLLRHVETAFACGVAPFTLPRLLSPSIAKAWQRAEQVDLPSFLLIREQEFGGAGQQRIEMRTWLRKIDPALLPEGLREDDPPPLGPAPNFGEDGWWHQRIVKDGGRALSITAGMMPKQGPGPRAWRLAMLDWSSAVSAAERDALPARPLGGTIADLSGRPIWFVRSGFLSAEEAMAAGDALAKPWLDGSPLPGAEAKA